MAHEQAFEKWVDTEQVFVLQWERSEQVFGQGDAMSVALELEYETFYPRLQVVPERATRPVPPARLRRRRVMLAAVVIGLLVLLMLPIRALGGKTLAGAAPTQGQEYVVQSGDTLASIAQRVDRADVNGMTQRLAHEIGSTVVVPGEHLLIP
jgi:hypothetical protein